MSHRIDVVAALVTVSLGVIGAAFAVFGPATFSYGTDWISAGSTSLWDEGVNGASVIYLAVMLAAALAVLPGVYLRSQGEESSGAAVLWVSTLVLFAGALYTLPGSATAVVPSALHTDTADSVGIGIYFFPVAFAAFVTTIISMALHHAPGRPAALRPH